MKTDHFEHLFRPNGHLTEDGTALYVDALKLDRTEELPGAVLEHVKTCEPCKGEVTGLFSLLAEEDYATSGPHPYFDAEATRRRVIPALLYRIAAVIVAAAGIGILLYTLPHRPDAPAPGAPSMTTRSTPDTAAKREEQVVAPKKTAESRELIAARFTESPELEDLMQSSPRSPDTEVQSPAKGARVSHGVVFRWTSSAAPPYELVVLDNRDRVIRTYTTSSDTLLVSDSLQAGLYYWKLLGEGNLLYVGKFLMR